MVDGRMWFGPIRCITSGQRDLSKSVERSTATRFRASFMAMGDGQHMLPIKAETRKAIGKEVGQTVHVTLEERL